MKKIYIYENGREIDVLDDKNEKIIKELQPVLSDLKDELEMFPNKKVGYRLSSNLYMALVEYPLMTDKEYLELDFEDILNYWRHYLRLVAYYNRYLDFSANKQVFCAYMGISDNQFKKLEQSEDADIRNLMNIINGGFIGLGFDSSESGNVSPTAIKQRLGAKGVGHNVVSASDDLIAEKVAQQASPQEIWQGVQSLFGDHNLKKITKGNK